MKVGEFSDPEEAKGAIQHAMKLLRRTLRLVGTYHERRRAMTQLSGKTCVPSKGDVPALEGGKLARLHRQIPGRELVEGHHLKKGFRFGSFREALDFANRVGELAEEQGHHPDVGFGWGWAEITIFTHRIDGLTENDFILAAKVDLL